MSKDVIVIGAGAAGLMAGIAAAQNGHRVTILEKNEKAGKKIEVETGEDIRVLARMYTTTRPAETLMGDDDGSV